MGQRLVLLFFLGIFALTVPPGAQEETDGDVVPAQEQPEAPALTVPAPAPAPVPALEGELQKLFGPENKITEAAVDIIKEAGDGKDSIGSFLKRLGIALGIIVLQAFLIWVFWRYLFRIITQRAESYMGTRIKPLTIKKFRFLSARQIINLILFGIRILKYVLTAVQLIITVPIVFSLFPSTQHLAFTLFNYILTPFKNILMGTVGYIPKLITIAVILLVTRYVLRFLKFLTIQIEREKLVISGFYPDWANPTFNILRVLLYAFTVAIIYPYLPGSDSQIFQGVSVLVGIIFSLGSSTAIGNMVAGVVITYMRSFKIGDRIKINDVTGFVVEKTTMVIRLKTHKNEYVTFPNMMILSSSVVNYHTSSDEDEEGLILNTTITFGYGTPWQTIQDILIKAALATSHVQKVPKPFVLQTAMDDFYANYQINCYTKEVELVPGIYSELYQNIQNGFRDAGLDMTAPHFRVNIPFHGPAPVSPGPGEGEKNPA
ncbi:MAG: mechanosensitive ion channel family protein [Treponema sp.]|jgi:small-conductance mechanosensitive channel|nr:mechanosensitive ion channel family protein [Treponema sp.]